MSSQAGLGAAPAPRMVTILLPRSEAGVRARPLAPRLPSLTGKRIGVLDNDMWRSMHILAGELETALAADWGVASVQTLTYHYAGSDRAELDARIERFAQEVDAAVSGLGN